MRAPAASAIAVACGTPMPSTPRLVHAWPGPTPTSTPTAPVRMRCSAVEYDAQPPTMIGDVELTDELLQVERLDRLRHVLGGHDRALDHEDVELGLEHVLGVLLDTLGRERRARGDAGVLDLADAPTDELFLDRLGVDLLHPPGRLLVRQLGDLLEQHVGVVVARPEPFEVEAADPAELPISIATRGDNAPSIAEPDHGQARSGTRRAPRRCRRPRDRASAGSGRSRCHRTRRPADPTCRCRSRLPPGTSCSGSSRLPGGATAARPGSSHPSRRSTVPSSTVGEEAAEDPRGRAPDRLVVELEELHGPFGAVEAPDQRSSRYTRRRAAPTGRRRTRDRPRANRRRRSGGPR